MGEMYSTPDFRIGLKVEIDDEPYEIVDNQHVQPGKGSGFMRTRLKSLITGNVLQRTFKSGEMVGKPDLDFQNMEFIYREDDHYVFMNTENYDQVHITESAVGDTVYYLKEGTKVEVVFYRGRPINIVPPNHIVLEVIEAEPGIKGDTASGATKNVTMETGLKIQVPLFIERGEKLKIDTRFNKYLERVK